MPNMSELGEKEFLRLLIPSLSADQNFLNGFGHDASVIDLGLAQHIAFKIDRAPFPVALRRGIGDYRTWGRLAVVANLSDLLAIGAYPRAMMVSLVLPGNFDSANAVAIVKGCEESCRTHNVSFLGGDTKEGSVAQVVGAAIGTVEKGFAFGRTPASPGDHLFLAGNVGGFAGTVVLMDKGYHDIHTKPEWFDVLTKPTARCAEGSYLSLSRKVVSACDLSDGLADALSIFCIDGAGITINEDKLPMHPHAMQAAKETGIPLWKFALAVGDWAIAFVVRYEDATDFKRKASKDLILHEIGRFNSTGLKLIQRANGSLEKIPTLINEHFRKRLEDDGSYIDDLLSSGL